LMVIEVGEKVVVRRPNTLPVRIGK